STSYSRGGRVVTETDSHTSGWRARIRSITRSLPTPEGPDRTVSRVRPGLASSSKLTACFYRHGPRPRTRGCAVSSVRLTGRRHFVVWSGAGRTELAEQCLALLVTQAAQATAVGDLQPFHDLGGSYLADARQGLQHRRHLQLADDVVVVGLVKHLGEALLAGLELVLQLGAGLTNLSRLFQRGGTLLGGERRERHQVSSNPWSWFCATSAGNLAVEQGFRQRQPARRGPQNGYPRAVRQLESALSAAARRPVMLGPCPRTSREYAGRTLLRASPKTSRSASGVPPWAPSPGASSGPLRAVKSCPVSPIVAPTTTPTDPRGLSPALMAATSSRIVWAT